MTTQAVTPAEWIAAADCVERSPHGDLLIQGHDARSLIEQWGTPLVVHLPDRVGDNVRIITNAFSRFFPKMRTYYAIKASYVESHIISALEAGAGLEVMSDLELSISEAHGIDGENLIVNGFGHTKEFFERIVRHRPAMITLDSREDIEMLSQVVRSHNAEPVAVGLRVSLSTTGQGVLNQNSKLGFTWEDGQFESVLKEVISDPAFQLRGLLAHQLSHCVTPATFGAHLDLVLSCMAEIERNMGFRFEVLDLGGGFESRLLLAARGVCIEDFAEEAGARLEDFPYPVEVYLEPGRYVAADAAVGLTKIVASKSRSEMVWKIADLGTNFLVPVPDSKFVPIPLREDIGDELRMTRLADRTCAEAPISEHMLLPSNSEFFAILNAGAYTSSFSHVWGPALPRIISMSSGQVRPLTDESKYIEVANLMYGHHIARTDGRGELHRERAASKA
ncbi:diaminopimelate decarboxylase family protein [Streptomyces sp. NPDC020707]|uniref:diaminopimelate decarboxylase family protein n=1 Tax=Streptomyces sp. NPDC020707 TaxID=3365084 RepID=UPI00379CFA15